MPHEPAGPARRATPCDCSGAGLEDRVDLGLQAGRLASHFRTVRAEREVLAGVTRRLDAHEAGIGQPADAAQAEGAVGGDWGGTVHPRLADEGRAGRRDGLAGAIDHPAVVLAARVAGGQQQQEESQSGHARSLPQRAWYTRTYSITYCSGQTLGSTPITPPQSPPMARFRIR